MKLTHDGARSFRRWGRDCCSPNTASIHFFGSDVKKATVPGHIFRMHGLLYRCRAEATGAQRQSAEDEAGPKRFGRRRKRRWPGDPRKKESK